MNDEPAFIVPHDWIVKNFFIDPWATQVTTKYGEIQGCVCFRSTGEAKAGWISPNGYAYIDFWYEGKRYSYRYARLVWYYYHGTWPPKDMHVHHKDSRTNNRITELRLVTKEEHKLIHRQMRDERRRLLEESQGKLEFAA